MMGRIVVTEFITLDSVIEKPQEWSFRFQNDETITLKHDELFASDCLLLGYTTYKIFAASWPSRTGEFADRMNSIPKYVVTKNSNLQWQNSYQLEGDAVESIVKLKKEIKRDILIAGSSRLVQSLVDTELIDIYRLLVHPLVLGKGKTLFDAVNKIDLELLSSKTFDTGMVLLEYKRKH
jgi:dihydrofolate reductase